MPILGFEEIKDCRTFRQLFAEFLGTFLYLAICLLAGANLDPNVEAIALANGLLVASIIQIIGQISGGHINPAVTVGVFVSGHIKLLKAMLYIAAQILGSLLGSLLAYAVTEQTSRHDLGATVPNNHLCVGQVSGLEFVMTFLLVAVVLSVLDVQRSGNKGLGSGPLAIGLCVTGCQISALSHTGSLNPVRSLGPAVVMNIWTHHWVYWIAPMLGGVSAGLTYRFLLTYRRNNENE